MVSEGLVSLGCMSGELPQVILLTAASVDGRITLGADQRLLDPGVAARWGTIDQAFPGRIDEYGARVVLEGSGSFVRSDAATATWPAPSTPPDLLMQDHVPRMAPRWFVVADSRGRVDWSFTGDEDTALHVLVCRDTPLGYLQRLRDLTVGYFVVGLHHVDLRLALSTIRREFGAEVVVANSGGTMNATLLRSGLVDILDVAVLPGLIGGATTPSVMDGPSLNEDQQPIRLDLIDSTVSDGAVRNRYRIKRDTSR